MFRVWGLGFRVKALGKEKRGKNCKARVGGFQPKSKAQVAKTTNPSAPHEPPGNSVRPHKPQTLNPNKPFTLNPNP